MSRSIWIVNAMRAGEPDLEALRGFLPSWNLLPC